MNWIIANNGEAYDGPTHQIGGVTYTGATRTADSRRLILGSAPEPKPVTKSSPSAKRLLKRNELY